MNDSQERLREMLVRRGDRVHSSLTVSDIRDAGLRTHRHPMRLAAPLLVAASVAIVVVVIAFTGGQSAPTVPPAGPGPGNSVTSPSHPAGPTTTAPATTIPTKTIPTTQAPTPTTAAVQVPATITVTASRPAGTSTVRATP
jgi:hypothetical protein